MSTYLVKVISFTPISSSGHFPLLMDILEHTSGPSPATCPSSEETIEIYDKISEFMIL